MGVAERPVVVVVDDDEAYLGMMEEVLAEEGYQVIPYGSSTGAYDLIVKARPNLVILDVRMGHPGAGLLLLYLIRLDAAIGATPIIVASADTRLLREKMQFFQEKQCLTLEKPFELPLLMRTIAAALHQ
jgi:DNA-binding response OmpR family regulator